MKKRLLFLNLLVAEIKGKIKSERQKQMVSQVSWRSVEKYRLLSLVSELELIPGQMKSHVGDCSAGRIRKSKTCNRATRMVREIRSFYQRRDNTYTSGKNKT